MTTTADSTAVADAREVIEAMSDRHMSVEHTFNWVLPEGREIQKTYYQEELGLFPAEHFALLITDVVDKITDDEKIGMQLGDLFRSEDSLIPSDFTPESVNEIVEDNLPVIKAIIKAIKMFPDVQLELYCLLLGIPQYEWDWAKSQMKQSPRRGGIKVKQGLEIIRIGIIQNADLIKDIVPGKAKQIWETWQVEVLGQELPSPTSTEPEVIPSGISMPTATTTSPVSPG